MKVRLGNLNAPQNFSKNMKKGMLGNIVVSCDPSISALGSVYLICTNYDS